MNEILNVNMNDTFLPAPPPSMRGSETPVHESSLGQPASSPSSGAAPPIQPSTNPAPLCSPRRRRSSIARLQKNLRDQINQMLDDGCPYTAICQQLTQQGIDLSDDSIARWKKGGYQDYRRELRLLDDSRLRYELTLQLAREQQGVDVFQAAHKIAAAQICDAVAELGAASLRQAIQLNPLNFLRALNSLSRLTAGGLNCERHLVAQAEREAELKRLEQPASDRALSPETLALIERELNLL